MRGHLIEADLGRELHRLVTSPVPSDRVCERDIGLTNSRVRSPLRSGFKLGSAQFWLTGLILISVYTAEAKITFDDSGIPGQLRGRALHSDFAKFHHISVVGHL